MMEAEQLHVISPAEAIDVTSLGNCFHGSSSASTCSSKCEPRDVSRTSNDELPGFHVLDTSSAASSIDFIVYSPVISLSADKSGIESRESNIDADIDECVQSMLASASELSCISAAGTSSLRKPVTDNSPKSQILDESGSVASEMSPDKLSDTSNDLTHSRRSSSPTKDSPRYDEELDSMISELNFTVQKLKRPKKSRLSPDDYTSHEHLLVDKILERQQSQRYGDTHAALMRTTSWASKIMRTPPFPTNSVPTTPCLSRARSVKLHNNVDLRNRMPSFRSNSHMALMGIHNPPKSPHKANYRISPVVAMRQFGPQDRRIHNYKREGMVVENPMLFGRFSAVDSLNTSISSLEMGSTIQQIPPYFDDMQEAVENGKRIDDYFDSTQQYLYQFQPCDKLEHYREVALNRLSRYVDKSVFVKIKQWGMKLDVLKTFKNKFNRAAPVDVAPDGTFGMPLCAVQAMNGNGLPFPRFFTDIIEYFKSDAIKLPGILRKCGNTKNVQFMRGCCSQISTQNPLPERFKTLEQVNDLNDLMKQYLRAIPNKIVPESVTEILICTLKANDPSKHLEIIRYILLLLPDENREALFYLLDFLAELASNSADNMMNIRNIVICIQPSICACDSAFAAATMVGKSRRKTVAVMPSRDKLEYTYLQRAFELMIEHHSELNLIPFDLTTSSKPEKKKRIAKDAMQPLQEAGDVTSLRCFVAKLFEDFEKCWPSWICEKISESGIIYATRDVNDNCSIKSSRLQLTVPGSPQFVFDLLTDPQKRSHWDLLTLWAHRTIIDPVNNEDVGQIVFNTYNDMQKQSAIVRAWEPNEAGTGRAYTAEKSCSHIFNVSNESVDVYHHVFLLCPFNGKTIINYITRIDIKGKSVEWYRITFREMMISQMNRLAMLAKDEATFLALN